ncbi:MAG: transposase [Flavobacteriaceae bacterium]|nr:transposase [Flavobacteriaceae bacterium]
MLDEGHQFRDVEIENMAKMMACGSSAMGYKQYFCENKDCSHSKIICFSCKSRFCNSCGQKATEQWITKQGEILPDCKYRHLTFTMPDVFWEIFKFNRQFLNNLFSLAADTLLHFADIKKLTIGMFVALHTYGRQLNFNCHIHLSLAEFGINKHGDLKNFSFPFQKLMGMWRYGVINLLRQNFELLTLPTHLSKKITNYQDWTRFLNGQYNRSWQVHIAKKTSHKKHTQNYLGSYIKKPPIAASRLKNIHNEYSQ